MKKKISIFFIIIVFIIIGFITVKAFIKKPNNNSENSDVPFFIQKQVLYSGITPQCTSFYESNWNLSVSQYTDIAIYIDKTNNDLTDSNTIKSLYIDNIKFKEKATLGTPSIYYQNPMHFATDTVYSDYLITDHLSYNILNFPNEENYNYYSTPNFFTDCSIPITLKYLNTDILKNYKISNNETLEFNGKILKDSNISLDSLKSTISLCINIVSNNNKLYKFDIDIQIPLTDNDSTIFDKNIYYTNTK